MDGGKSITFNFKAQYLIKATTILPSYIDPSENSYN